MRTALMKLLAIALLILLAACKTTDSGEPTSVCAQWQGISWSAKDTPTTIDEVKANNARRTAWCT